MAEIQPGDTMSIADDIAVDGVPTFIKGEPVVVQQVSPNAGDPTYRYVVFSSSTNKWFHLRGADLVPAGAQVAQSAYPSPAGVAGYQPADSRCGDSVKVPGSRRGLVVALVVIAVVIIAGAVGATVVLGKKKTPEVPAGGKSTLTTGIVTGTTAEARQAGSILLKSADAMASVTSVKTDMTMEAQVNGRTIAGQMQIEQVKKGASDIETKMTGVLQGQECIMYVVGSTAFLYANGSWTKAKFPVVPSASGVSGMAMGSLGYVQDYLRAAPDPAIVSEDATSYAIRFNLGPDYFRKEIEKMKAGGVDQGSDAARANRDMQLTFTINKTDYLVSDLKEAIVSHGAQAGGDVSTSMDFKLYGYDTPVSIIVPPEAQNAPEMPLPGE